MAEFKHNVPGITGSTSRNQKRPARPSVSLQNSDNEPSSPVRPTGPYSRRRPQASPSRDKPAQQSQRRPAPKRPASRAPSRQPSTSRSRQAKPPGDSHPVIGITASFQRFPSDDKHDCEYFYLYEPYVAAVHAAGGVPIIIPVGIEGRYINKIFELIDGLLLSGGGDIDPNRYNDLLTTKLKKVEPKKDQTEIDLFNLAFNKNIPVLGICRGVQVMNVALDGTLYQDITSQVRMALNHDPDMPHDEAAHAVDIPEDTRLFKALGETRIWTNSWHHQGIKLHGKGLLVNAKASDDIVEGIEHPNKRWVIGVQWHPEMMWRTDKVQAKLFKAFVDACKG